jgi:hypothetical protein
VSATVSFTCTCVFSCIRHTLLLFLFKNNIYNGCVSPCIVETFCTIIVGKSFFTAWHFTSFPSFHARNHTTGCAEIKRRTHEYYAVVLNIIRELLSKHQLKSNWQYFSTGKSEFYTQYSFSAAFIFLSFGF